MNQKKKLSLLVLAFVLVISMFAPISHVLADDIDKHPLELEMREAIRLGIMNGYDQDLYKPNEKVTRAQFAAFIKRALNLPEATGKFSDVSSNMTLKTSIYAVAEAGIMQGVTSDQFSPETLISREQVALTVENALTYSDMELVPKATLFSDVNLMTSRAKLAVFHANHYNIINGIPSGEQLNFEPKSNATRAQAAAFIVRFLKAKENYVPPVVIEPEPGDGTPTDPIPPPPPGFQLATIQDGKITRVGATYTTYTEAVTVFNNSTTYQGLYNGSELIRVKQGIAYGNAYKNNIQDVTVVYFDTDFKKQATYIEHGREMRYISSNDKYIKVQVGATIGFVKHSQAEMIPLALVNPDRRDYYKVSDYGTLIHFIVYHNKNSLTSYIVGPAPTTMTKGVRYYSHDGIHFSTNTDQAIIKHVPYFQYLSARSVTNYTAAEIDAYILKVLGELEVSQPIKYANASTKSKLIGLGEQLKEIEQTQRINALMILSLGIHESNYGMSDTAQQCNNLFGLYKYDSLTKLCPEEGIFDTPAESVSILISKFLNPYSDPTPQSTFVQKNQGAAFGNKTTGFNVNYASDPTWGAKAGYHLYNVDKGMGGKDLNAYKKIAFTKYGAPTPINVRTSPTTTDNANVLFTYQPRYVGVFEGDESGKGIPLGYPLTIVETVKGSDGFNWYKIISDRIDAQYGYIREDVVNVIEYP